MNDECGEMEGLNGGEEISVGLGFEEKLVPLKAKAEDAKMDGEGKKRSGSNRRKKQQVEVKVEPEDDEPIGSLFKLKKHRNPKRVKAGLGDGGKVEKVEVRAEELVGEEEDLEEMDYTLASFRKKLKGPKVGRDGGSGKGRGGGLNVLGLIAKQEEEDPSCSGGGDGSALLMDLGSGDMVKGRGKKLKGDEMGKDDGSGTPVCSGDGSALLDVRKRHGRKPKVPKMDKYGGSGTEYGKNSDLSDAGLRLKQVEESPTYSGDGTDLQMPKRRQKRSGLATMSKKTQDKFETGDVLDQSSGVKGYDESFMNEQKEKASAVGESFDHSSDENLELSAFIRKSQSGSAKKARSSSTQKKRKVTTASGDVLGEKSDVASGDVLPYVKSDDELNLIDLALVKQTVEIQIPNERPSQSSVEEGTMCSPVQQLVCASRIPSRIQKESAGFVVDRLNEYSEGIEKPAPQNDVKFNKVTQIPEEALGNQDVSNQHCGLKKCSKGDQIKFPDCGGDTFNGTCREILSVVLESGEIEMNFGGFPSHKSGTQNIITVAGVLGVSPSLVDEEPSTSFIMSQPVVPCINDDKIGRKCEENLTDKCLLDGDCLNQPLSGKKLSSLTRKNEAEDAVRYDEVAQPFGVQLEGLSVQTVQNSSMVSVHSKIEEASKLKGFVQYSDGRLENSQLKSTSSSPEFLKKDGTDIELVGSYKNTELRAPISQKDESLASDDLLNHISTKFHQVYSASPLYKPSDDAVERSVKEVTCSQSTDLEPTDALPDDAGKEFDPDDKDMKLLPLQRIPRKVKKRRHGDMAYEGDTDWDFLMHGQGLLGTNHIFYEERPTRVYNKFDYPSNMGVDTDCCTAAVAAGLKARAAGPFEKIRFKDILKRRGGLQEYLECRNLILSLWSRDTSRILPLSDCGVRDTPSEDQPPRASLIRDIYAFLNHNGYINAGIACEKEKAEPDAKTQHRRSKESTIDGSYAAQVVDSEDGVAFITGDGKSSEHLTDGKKDVLLNSEKPTSEATNNIKSLVTSTGSDLSALGESEECLVNNEQENGWIDAKLPNRMANLDALTNPSSEVVDDGPEALLGPEHIKDSYGIQSIAVDPVQGKANTKCNLEVKRRIIVIGAGPAGLTAARHLQRQGFAVTILEARSRLGGRVYTDRSSLSVPVDLGASIITGVEADVATERRPDPSSLICSQLGLELTVLNSDCPLYDIKTGQKVPAELDEALEAEYNSLLDDMFVLVGHKGERVMRMSLEDGLEYALKKRRMARMTSESEECELGTSVNASFDIGANGLDRKTPNRISSKEEILNPLERRVMNWHYAHLEYGCAALLKDVSLPYWNQDDVYGGFGGAHCMIKGGYSTVIESLGKGLEIYLDHVVTEVSYSIKESGESDEQHGKVKVSTSNGNEFLGDAVLVTVPLGCLKANTIKFSPSLPEWKQSSIRQLGFGVLNKVVLQFPEVFWDDSVDYFGATAEETDQRGQCFMFWNVKKTVGAPVLIALVVGKAAIEGQSMTSSYHVNHAVKVLRKLFGDASVPDPVASVVTDWGQDPFSRGAYSYVAVGSSGEDYDIIGKPVDNCVFFAGEATCKEHPDTVGGAMMSGLREAVRIIDILDTGDDHMAEVEAMEAAQRQSESERNEVRDILKRLEAVELSDVLRKGSFDGDQMLTKEALLQDMFQSAKTTSARLHLAKKLLSLPVETLKSFAGTKEGLSTLNSWILDSMGKDGTQLLRHCVRLLVLVSTNLLAVRLSGIGRTVKEKVCVHTSRDIRAVASQLVSMWIEVFRKEKAANGGLKLLRQSSATDSFKNKPSKDSTSGKLLRTTQSTTHNRGNTQVPSFTRKSSPNKNVKKMHCIPAKLEPVTDLKADGRHLHSQGVVATLDSKTDDSNVIMSEEEAAAFAAAEAARAAALAAAEAYASKEAECSTLRDLPKIPSFHKFARREQYAQMDESDLRRKWSGGVLGRQDCLSDIDSRNCKVRDWTLDFSAACPNLDNSRMSGDNYTQQSYSNEVMYQVNPREYSGESVATECKLTKAWLDSAGSGGVKDYHAIERWQSQAAAASSDFFHSTLLIGDEEDSNTASKSLTGKYDKGMEESAASQGAETNKLVKNQPRGVERIKKAVVDYVGSLLMPLYKARKIDKEGYKTIMKKSATKVMEQTTDAEKLMTASEFLDFKRKNKIRAFVDQLIEKHMAMTPVDKP